MRRFKNDAFRPAGSSFSTVCGALAAVLLGGVAYAGIVFELETQDHRQSPPRLGSTSVAVRDDSLTMEILPGGQGARGSVIYRGDRQELIIVDPEQQSYFVMDGETIDSLLEQVQRMKNRFADKLDNVPEAQRAMVEQTMNQQPSSPAELPTTSPQVQHVGDNVEVNGYPCARYEVYRDGHKISDVWVTDWQNVEGGRELEPAFQAMAEFFRQMADSLAQQSGAAGHGMGENMYTTITDYHGFPVACYNYKQDGSVRDAVILRNSSRQQLEVADFEPPPNYRRQYLFQPE